MPMGSSEGAAVWLRTYVNRSLLAAVISVARANLIGWRRKGAEIVLLSAIHLGRCLGAYKYLEELSEAANE
jgi:hypothetical protein